MPGKSWSEVTHKTREGFVGAAVEAKFATCFYLIDNEMGSANPKEALIYETVLETENGPELHVFRQDTPAPPRKKMDFREYTPFETVEGWTAPVQEALEGAGGVFAYGHIFAMDAQETFKDAAIPVFEISLSNLSGVKYSQGKEQEKRKASFAGLSKVLGASELSQWGDYVYATGFEGRSLNILSYWNDSPAEIAGLPGIKKHSGEYEPGMRFVHTSMPPKYQRNVAVE